MSSQRDNGNNNNNNRNSKYKDPKRNDNSNNYNNKSKKNNGTSFLTLIVINSIIVTCMFSLLFSIVIINGISIINYQFPIIYLSIIAMIFTIIAIMGIIDMISRYQQDKEKISSDKDRDFPEPKKHHQ